MRKAWALLAIVLLVFVWVGTAAAVPFEIGAGGSIVVDTAGGLNYGNPLGSGSKGGFEYGYSSFAHEFSLEAGTSSELLKLFTVEISGLATGKITATVNFVRPDVDADPSVVGTIEAGSFDPRSTTVELSGEFGLLGSGDWGAANIAWTDPVFVGYGAGGLLGLDLENVSVRGASGFDIFGRVTNLESPVAGGQQLPVPEPATLLLLGTGLLGVAASKRRAGR